MVGGLGSLLQEADNQQSNKTVNILIVTGITGSYWRRVIKMERGRCERSLRYWIGNGLWIFFFFIAYVSVLPFPGKSGTRRHDLLAPEHEQRTKEMIPPKSSVVHQRVESRLFVGARRIYSRPHTGVGPVGLVQGLVSTFMRLVGEAYKLPCEPALPSLRECQQACLWKSHVGKHSCSDFSMVVTVSRLEDSITQCMKIDMVTKNIVCVCLHIFQPCGLTEPRNHDHTKCLDVHVPHSPKGSNSWEIVLNWGLGQETDEIKEIVNKWF